MIRWVSLAALAGVMAASPVSAQDVPGRTRIWGAVGLGAAMPTSGGDAIVNIAQLVLQRQPHHVAIRGVVLHDLDRATDLIVELGPLYGRTRDLTWGYAAIASGVSGVAFDACPDDDDSCFTVGVPLVAEVAITRRFIGLGIQAYANLNDKAAYAGAALFLQVGRL